MPMREQIAHRGRIDGVRIAHAQHVSRART
jgi:hypothetical protein